MKLPMKVYSLAKAGDKAAMAFKQQYGEMPGEYQNGMWESFKKQFEDNETLSDDDITAALGEQQPAMTPEEKKATKAIEGYGDKYSQPTDPLFDRDEEGFDLDDNGDRITEQSVGDAELEEQSKRHEEIKDNAQSWEWRGSTTDKNGKPVYVKYNTDSGRWGFSYSKFGNPKKTDRYNSQDDLDIALGLKNSEDITDEEDFAKLNDNGAKSEQQNDKNSDEISTIDIHFDSNLDGLNWSGLDYDDDGRTIVEFDKDEDMDEQKDILSKAGYTFEEGKDDIGRNALIITGKKSEEDTNYEDDLMGDISADARPNHTKINEMVRGNLVEEDSVKEMLGKYLSTEAKERIENEYGHPFEDLPMDYVLQTMKDDDIADLMRVNDLDTNWWDEPDYENDLGEDEAFKKYKAENDSKYTDNLIKELGLTQSEETDSIKKDFVDGKISVDELRTRLMNINTGSQSSTEQTMIDQFAQDELFKEGRQNAKNKIKTLLDRINSSDADSSDGYMTEDESNMIKDLAKRYKITADELSELNAGGHALGEKTGAYSIGEYAFSEPKQYTASKLTPEERHFLTSEGFYDDEIDSMSDKFLNALMKHFKGAK